MRDVLMLGSVVLPNVLGCRVDILGTNCKKLKSKDEWRGGGGGGAEPLWLQYV